MTDQETRIKAKINARKDARDLRDFLEWEDGTGADYAEAFLNEMEKLLPCRQPPKPDKPKWNYSQLAATVMPFGCHEGERLEDVPSDYLDWLTRNNEDFFARLLAYMKHPERSETK